MFATLPTVIQDFMSWDWPRMKPYLDDLAARPLDAGSVENWLADWTRVASLIEEMGSRLYVATAVDTTDSAAEDRFNTFLSDVQESYDAAAQTLKEKLLGSGLTPAGLEIPLRGMRAEADLFREANLPLLTEDERLGSEHARIIGAQTIVWEGEELTLTQLAPLSQTTDRALRERLWRLTSERRLADRETLNALWAKLLANRRQIAANADMPDYRAYRWRDLRRFDYTPEDALAFDNAILQVVVPAATRIYEKNRRHLAVETLRPWDTDSMNLPIHLPALKPYSAPDELETKASAIFGNVDPVLADYFETMRRENMLDLPNRKGKAPGGFCMDYPATKRPYIFMNAVGMHDDVQTMLHEGGHAFHAFEASRLPYLQQKNDGIPVEFAEVASMSMELLGAPYLAADHGGFYADPHDAARAALEHLEGLILFWPYMAVVDSFQQWAYTHPDAAANADRCDAAWTDLALRYMPAIDWSGLDDALATGWHRKLHIFTSPLYYIEYGLAQLGAVQVWRNSLSDRAGAVARYRHALSLGNTATLPDLFAAAGAQFKPDAGMLGDCVGLIEREIERLEAT